MKSIMIAILIATAGASLAADLPPLPEFDAWMDQPGHVWVDPDGSGLSLLDAYGPGGAGADATIHIILRDWNDNPVVNYPAEDIWLDGGSSTDFAFCIGGTIASGDTDDQGYTSIVGPFRAGGQIPPGTQPSVLVAGDAIWNTDLPLTVNSPDINGDLVVNLADVAALTSALGTYDWRMDFNDDGAINLGDIAIFVGRIGAECP
jgi:hypothetical protein